MSSSLISTNPANYEVLGEVQVTTDEEVVRLAAKARLAQPLWRGLGIRGRVAALEKLVNVFKER
jgi:acyl-CoA reductase-like NAD-dependent aldehyde dehydrogenase